MAKYIRSDLKSTFLKMRLVYSTPPYAVTVVRGQIIIAYVTNLKKRSSVALEVLHHLNDFAFYVHLKIRIVDDTPKRCLNRYWAIK